MTIRYQIAYQLGGSGSQHRKLTAAVRAASAAATRCRRSGDHQGIRIVALEKHETRSGGWEWCERELSREEYNIVREYHPMADLL